MRRVAYYDDNSIKNYTLYTFSSPTPRVWSKLLVNQFILPCKAHILRKHFGLLQGSLHQILTRAQSWFRFTGIDISFTLGTPTEFVAALLTIGDLKAGVGSWGWRMNWCEVNEFFVIVFVCQKAVIVRTRERGRNSLAWLICWICFYLKLSVEKDSLDFLSIEAFREASVVVDHSWSEDETENTRRITPMSRILYYTNLSTREHWSNLHSPLEPQ